MVERFLIFSIYASINLISFTHFASFTLCSRSNKCVCFLERYSNEELTKSRHEKMWKTKEIERKQTDWRIKVISYWFFFQIHLQLFFFVPYIYRINYGVLVFWELQYSPPFIFVCQFLDLQHTSQQQTIQHLRIIHWWRDSTLFRICPCSISKC